MHDLILEVFKLIWFHPHITIKKNYNPTDKKTLKFMHHGILLNKLAFTVKPSHKRHIIAMCKT